MSQYAIEFLSSARKEFEKLPGKIRSRAIEALKLLAQNPYSELLKIKKLKGPNDLYRIRLGDYRLVYEIRDKRLVIVIVKIGNRRDVYKN